MNTVGKYLALSVLALALGIALVSTPYLLNIPESMPATTSKPTYTTIAPTETYIPSTTNTVGTSETPALSTQIVIPATTPLSSSSYTSIYAARNITYLFRIGDWSIVIELTSDGKGMLVVRYDGDKPLEVENPLLPPIAGLDITLSYSDPSKDTVIRKLGTYYHGKIVLRPGNESSVGFDARGLRLICVEGEILGKIPVRIMLPLDSKAMESCTCITTVTVTKTTTIHGETQTTTTGYCEFVKEAEYPEPMRSAVTRVELDNETVVSDGVLEIHVPLTAMDSEIPLVFENKKGTPLWVLAYCVEYIILNATEDGVHYRQVNRRIVYAVPMTTIPPLPSACRDKQPPDTSIINYGFYVLEPGEKSTLLKLTIPTNIDELQGFREGWVYIKARIKYAPIKEVYRIDVDTAPINYYYYRAVAFYNTREMEIVFRTHINLSSISDNTADAEQESLKPWIINDYGGLIVVKINRTMFKNLGDGYWLLVLPGTEYNIFDDIALNQVAEYLNIGEPEVVFYAAWPGENYVIKANETRSSNRDLKEIHRHIKEFLDDLSRRGLTPAEMKLFIKDSIIHIIVGGIGEPGVEEFAKLAHQHFKDLSKRVIVVEKLGWLPPGGPYQHVEMLDALREVSCFFSFGEAVYGTSMIFNVSCVEEMAREKNMAFNEAVEYIVREVKELNTLIRKYLPWQEILVVVAKTPKLIMPIGTASATTTETAPEIQTESTPVQQNVTPLNTATTARAGRKEYTFYQLTMPIIAAIVLTTIAIIVKYKHF